MARESAEQTTGKENGRMTKQEEMRQNEIRRAATRGKIRQAIARVERERMDCEKALREIEKRLPISLGLYYLWNAPKDEIMRLEREREEHKRFIREVYPLAKQGLSKLDTIGYIDDIHGPGPKKSKDSKELPS